MKELTVNAVLDNLDTVTEFVNTELDSLGCPSKVQQQIDIAIDELFSNIVRYAYPENVGEVKIRLELDRTEKSVDITFFDSGTPYDPLMRSDPDVTLSAEERSPGGLGIFMVKKLMDDVKYAYTDGQNILTVKKHF